MTTEERRMEYASLRHSLDKILPKECGNCGSESGLQIHHIVPLSCGGSNKITNLARLCNECHAKAHGGLNFISKSEEARRDSVRRGGRSSGSMPLGYGYEKGAWVIDEENAWIIRFIFRMRFVFEYSTNHIARILTHMAVPTVNGAEKWTHPVIKRIIDNPRYLGENVYNGESFGNTIPPIIDGELADAKRKFEEKYEGSRIRPKAPPIMG